MLQREELFVVAEVPLAEDGGGVAARFAEFAECGYAVVDAMLRSRVERAEDADAFGVAAGHEGGARGGAHGSGRVEIGEDATFLGHLVEVRRFVRGGTEGADVGVAHVVDEDDNDVGRARSGFGVRGFDLSDR